MNPREGNDQFPLPSDYQSLTREGQRQARVAVCRDSSSATAYITGHMFFRNHYLAPQGETFYQEGGLLPPCPGHFLMMRDFFRFPLCVEAFPRGHGKSTIFSKELPLREVVCFPHRQVVVCTASEKLVADKAAPVMIQLEENELILADFGINGRLVPKKGARRIFNKQYMQLLNGSVLEELTIGSRQRGTRASRYILDDPEFDPDSNKQERHSELRRKLQKFIEHDVLYMLNPKHMKFFWIGTMIGARSYLYHVCFSKEKKYRPWTRRVQSGAVIDQKSGKVKSGAWAARFPVKHLQMLMDVNAAAFNTEIQNAPAEEQARLLKLSPTANDYTVNKLPSNLDVRNAAHLPHPEAVMTYHYWTGYNDAMQMKWQIDHVNQKEYFDGMTKIATFDYAENKTSMSDLKALAITGIDSRNAWWRLDLWAGRMKDEFFWDFMIKFCASWRVDIIAPETAARQKFLIEIINRRMFDGAETQLIPADWHPQVIPVDYPQGMDNTNKGYRINHAFEYRIPRGHLKLPASYQNKWPFNEERNQFKFFTIDLSELKFDDIIDAGAMVNYVPHGKGTAAPTKGVNQTQVVVENIRQGKPFFKGEEGLVGMPLEEIKPEYLAALIKLRDENNMPQNDFTNVWDRPAVVA